MPAIIQIVEDHEAIRWGLREWLEAAFPGWRVIEATSGEEAVVLTIGRVPPIWMTQRCQPIVLREARGCIMTSEEKKLLVRRFYEEIVNTGRLDSIDDFIAPE